MKTTVEMNGVTVDPNDVVGLIRGQMGLLQSWCRDGRRPSQHLLQDIRIYEFMLRGEPAEVDARCRQYLEKMSQLRKSCGGFGVRKIDAARALGWPVE